MQTAQHKKVFQFAKKNDPNLLYKTRQPNTTHTMAKHTKIDKTSAQNYGQV